MSQGEQRQPGNRWNDCRQTPGLAEATLAQSTSTRLAFLAGLVCTSSTRRTAVYGPVRTVVSQGQRVTAYLCKFCSKNKISNAGCLEYLGWDLFRLCLYPFPCRFLNWDWSSRRA